MRFRFLSSSGFCAGRGGLAGVLGALIPWAMKCVWELIIRGDLSSLCFSSELLLGFHARVCVNGELNIKLTGLCGHRNTHKVEVGLRSVTCSPCNRGAVHGSLPPSWCLELREDSFGSRPGCRLKPGAREALVRPPPCAVCGPRARK